MTQKIHLITYGDDKYKKSKDRIYNEATKSNWFDTIEIYGPKKLTKSFKIEFKNILNRPREGGLIRSSYRFLFKYILNISRGGGYYIWKFDIIKQHLNKISHNDILIYVDGGCSINLNGKKRFDEYIEMLNHSNESIISFELEDHTENEYTIKELFHYFNMNVNNSKQILSGILIMKNNDKMMKIIDECINVLRNDPLLITDYYNKNQQCSEFKDNRHDQSILSLVTKKYGAIIIPDETYFRPFGNEESLQYPFWATRIRC